jgi:hypothetical protein
LSDINLSAFATPLITLIWLLVPGVGRFYVEARILPILNATKSEVQKTSTFNFFAMEYHHHPLSSSYTSHKTRYSESTFLIQNSQNLLPLEMTSPSPTPSPNGASWKRKFEVLEAQCAATRELGPRVKEYVDSLSLID